MAPQLEVSGLVTIHSSAPASVVMSDGRTVEHFHDGEAGDSYFRVNGGTPINHGFSDTANPKLHPVHGVIYRTGNELRRVDPETPGASELLFQFSGYTTVTIGQGEGPIMDNRFVPLVLDGTSVGVYDLQVQDFWASDVPNGEVVTTGYALVGQPDTVYCLTSARNVYHVHSDNTFLQPFSSKGHATSIRVGDEVWFVVTPSDFSTADLNKWGVGGDEVLAIDMATEEKRWQEKLEWETPDGDIHTGWVAQHYGPLTLEDGTALLAMSFEVGGDFSDVAVYHLNAPAGPTQIVQRFTTNQPYAAYFDQKKPALGIRGQEVICAYTEGNDTWSVPVMDITEPGPDPGEPMSDLTNLKDALDTASPPVAYTETPVNQMVGTTLTFTDATGQTVVLHYDENGDLISV